MKKIKRILLAAVAVMTAAGANAQVIVNADGTHSTVHGRGGSRVIVNSDGTHSSIHGRGRVIVNADGTHSTIHGRSGRRVIVSDGGTHAAINGKLPAAAVEFVGRHFADTEISLAVMYWAVMGTTYDVVFADGRSVEFDRKGGWEKVECGRTAVPDAIVPEVILCHIVANYSGSRVCEISHGRRKWKVGLDNGLELKFDRQSRLIEIDD